MQSGKEFVIAASFPNGVIGVWSVKGNKEPDKLITPQAHGMQQKIVIITVGKFCWWFNFVLMSAW